MISARFACFIRASRPISILKLHTGGKATRVGTMEFFKRFSAPFYHEFYKCQLFINPTIVDLPRDGVGASELPHLKQYDHCLRVNRSNCFTMYHHDGVATERYFKDIVPLLINTKTSRENLVFIAKIAISVFPGCCPYNFQSLRCFSSPLLIKLVNLTEVDQQILEQIRRAKALCNLSHFDIVILECDAHTFQDNKKNLDEAIGCLEELCRTGDLATYGFYINVAPYCYHSPNPKTTSKLITAPGTMEDILRDDLEHADIIMYPASPTISIPATYPMLDPEPEEIEKDPELKGTETTRTFTRIAANPLTGYYGGGTDMRLDAEASNALEKYVSGLNQLQAERSSNNLELVDKNSEDPRFDPGAIDNDVTELTSEIEQLVKELELGVMDQVLAKRKVGQANLKLSRLKTQFALYFAEMKSREVVNGETGDDAAAEFEPVSSSPDNILKFKSDPNLGKHSKSDLDTTQPNDSTSDSGIKDAKQLLTDLETAIREIENVLSLPHSDEYYSVDENDNDDDTDDNSNDEVAPKAADPNINEFGIDESEALSYNVDTILTANDESISGDVPTEHELRQLRSKVIALKPRKDAFYFITDQNNLQKDRRLGINMNELCPSLISTPKLEDKALRLVYSIGFDVVSIESDLIVKAGRIGLKKCDFLSPSDSDDFFGEFKLMA